jgi:hypothetical protein
MLPLLSVTFPPRKNELSSVIKPPPPLPPALLESVPLVLRPSVPLPPLELPLGAVGAPDVVMLPDGMALISVELPKDDPPVLVELPLEVELPEELTSTLLASMKPE